MSKERPDERGQAESSWWESEELYRLMALNASDVLYVIHPDTNQLDWYGQIDQKLGYAEGEFPWTMEAWGSSIHPSDYGRVVKSYIRSWETGAPFNEEYRIRRKDGTYIYWSDRGRPLYADDGKMVRFIGACTDITERKRAEELLEQRSAAMKASMDGIVILDQRGQVVYLNDSHAAIYGYDDPSELLGKSWETHYGEEERRRFRHGIMPTLERTGRWRGEAVGTRRDGSTFPQEVSLARIDGVGLVCVVRDITERKLIEAELAQARDAALESARAKSKFLANMSHEIRTPMNGVVGMTGLLLKTRLSAQQREFAEAIRASADSLLTIINDILDLSKIEAGKLQFETLDFDLRATVEGAVGLLAGQAQAKGVEMASLVYGDVPTALRGDPGRLRQVLSNLISNSVKFTERGEVVVRVSKECEAASHVSLRFEVSDTGIGIPVERQRRLFQPFTQASDSTTSKYGGTGLSLAISKQLVEYMGGEMGVESAPGRGSTFHFTARFEKQRVTAAPALPAELRGARVLVVDDNETGREILHHQLTSRGLRAGCAGGGAEALAMLRGAAAAGGPYDLAIIDMQMPEMDGLTLARAIRSEPAAAAIKLLMLGSLADGADVAAVRGAGVAAYLAKPVKESQLFDCLAGVMTRGAGAAAGPWEPADQSCAPSDHPALPPGRGRGRGARVLVAEDKIVNQKVVSYQLQMLGHSADVVSNGREALEALERAQYDIVLMDCQMPEVDGYEATAEIRRREGASKHTPIIAMTAYAFESDRKKCMAAGMDDYICKPASPETLEAVIARWAAAPRPVPPESSIEGIIDPAALAGFRSGARERGDDRLTELVGLFLSDAQSLLGSLRGAAAEGDAEALRRTAHALKGSSSVLGIRTMAALSQELEQASGGPAPVVNALLARMEEEFGRIRRACEAGSRPAPRRVKAY